MSGWLQVCYNNIWYRYQSYQRKRRHSIRSLTQPALIQPATHTTSSQPLSQPTNQSGGHSLSQPLTRLFWAGSESSEILFWSTPTIQPLDWLSSILSSCTARDRSASCMPYGRFIAHDTCKQPCDSVCKQAAASTPAPTRAWRPAVVTVDPYLQLQIKATVPYL